MINEDIESGKGVKNSMGMAFDKVYFGDCLQLMKEVDSNSIDLILCDLPYG